MRSLDTNRAYILKVVRQGFPQPVIRQGFLLNKYLGYATEMMVQLTDPQRSTRGTIVKARIRPGTILPVIDRGTPVAVQIRHGQAEIIGLSASGGIL